MATSRTSQPRSFSSETYGRDMGTITPRRSSVKPQSSSHFPLPGSSDADRSAIQRSSIASGQTASGVKQCITNYDWPESVYLANDDGYLSPQQVPSIRTGDRIQLSRTAGGLASDLVLSLDDTQDDAKNGEALGYEQAPTSAIENSLKSPHLLPSKTPTDPKTFTPDEYNEWALKEVHEGRIAKSS